MDHLAIAPLPKMLIQPNSELDWSNLNPDNDLNSIILREYAQRMCLPNSTITVEMHCVMYSVMFLQNS